MIESTTDDFAVVNSNRTRGFDMDWASAIIAGIVATGVMTVLMAMGTSMGIHMDMPKMLGAMFVDPGSSMVSKIGLAVHIMMGVAFAIIYAALFDALDVDASLAWGALFGAGHGIVAGMGMGMMPMMHPRMGEGEGLPVPGPFGVKLGMMAPVGLIVLHVIFGTIVGGIYSPS